MDETTLLIRHLPAELSKDERKDFLHHFGASRVRVMGQKGPTKNTAFAVFSNREHATEVLHQLHQTDFLGSKLVVEFARSANNLSIQDQDQKIPNGQEIGQDRKTPGDEKKRTESREIKFDDSFATWGLKYPRRPELKYSYPPPSPTILANIVNGLVAVPRFYTQVLHLMNKLDLPAPFGAVTPAPPVSCPPGPDAPPVLSQPDDVGQREMDISSSEESEMDSEEAEEGKAPGSVDRKRVEYPHRRTTRRLAAPKRPRLSEFQKDAALPHSTSTGPVVPVQEVFDQMPDVAQPPKKIALNLSVLSSGADLSHRGERKRTTYLGRDELRSKKSYDQSVAFGQGDPAPSSTRDLPPDATHHHHLASSYRQASTVSSIPSSSLPPPPPAVADRYLPSAEPAIHDDHHHNQQQQGQQLQQPQQPQSQQHLSYHYHQHHMATLSSSSGQDHSITTGASQEGSMAKQTDHQIIDRTDRQTSSSLHHPHHDQHLPFSKDDDHEDKDSTPSGFGIIQHITKPKETNDATENEDGSSQRFGKIEFISSSALRRGRLSKEEMKESSVFRRYDAGEVSCRLYIKNVAKQASEEDLHRIYGRYVDWDSEAESNMFDIRLMKEGRMKGQAFVTLPSPTVAQDAVDDTNSFLLKGKPLVVQFARSAKAQEDSAASKS